MTRPPDAQPVGRTVVLMLLASLAFLLLMGLGSWQLQRLAWKEDLVAAVEARRLAEPIAAPAPEALPEKAGPGEALPEKAEEGKAEPGKAGPGKARLGFDLAALRYQPVTLKGTYDHSEERHLFFPLTAPQGGPFGGRGVMVFTPVQTTQGWWVLVNRGFVPERARDPATRLEGQVTGVVQLEGLIRGFENRSFLTPAPSNQDELFFVRDRADLLADLEGEGRVFAPYYLDLVAAQTPTGGLPQAGETRISFANNHLQYALTWYGLAAALVGVLIAQWRQRSQHRPSLRS